MRTLKRFTAILLSVFLLLTFTACDNSDKEYIYFTLTEQPETLDPQTAKTDTELMIVKNIFEGLLRKDEDGKIVCGVAESFKKKGLTYTFKLREDAIWSNEDPVVAQDFVFAFKRAVSPETKSPFVQKLFCIKNAKSINSGLENVNALGVKAIDKHTLKITLETNDPDFEETLTTSIAMPCKQTFFYKAAGKYGLFRENILSNGSYKLSKWGKEIFGIRLYRNPLYKGNFAAKNAAVFLSIDKERTPIQVLLENDADIAFINTLEIANAKQSGLNVLTSENICWFLTISNGFTKEIRKSLISLATPQVFSDNLLDGYSSAQSIYPQSIVKEISPSGMPIYDLESAKNMFSASVASLEDKKFPSNVVLYYYDDGFSKNIVTAIAGHWQNHLGAFVNIEAVSSPDLLLSQLTEQTYAMSIFPVSADTRKVDQYLKKFGIDYNNENLNEVQSKLLSSSNISPLMSQSTALAHHQNLKNINFLQGEGTLDFAYIVKHND